MKNKKFAYVLLFSVLIHIISVSLPVISAEDNIIEISSKEDFAQFSRNCTLDTWSEGKTVNLTCDIDFSGSDFLPVPTFGGTFNGNGYTVSGIEIKSSGSYLGVFRYIQKSGKVTGLNVKANIIPVGSKCFVGGVAGENSGIIELCSFNGIIEGENVIGGIAGSNTDAGKIISCLSYGSISGENSTGGIAGKNSGMILDCTNNAEINTFYEEDGRHITDIETDTGAIIEEYKNTIEENEEESVLGDSDTGGIAGYSSGIIQGSTNKAQVGYPHVGYNVGGIAGRQSGYILGCVNQGYIQGRKDVGGIVGQAEPYITLHVSESGLEKIKEELNKLSGMTSRLLSDTDNLGKSAENHLNNISQYTQTARNNTEYMLDSGVEFADDNLGKINAYTALIANTLEKLEPAFENLEMGNESLTDALSDISAAVENIKIYAPELGDSVDKIVAALSDISDSGKSIKKAVSKIGRALGDLDDAVTFSNPNQAKEAISKISESIKDIIKAKNTIKSSLETIENLIRERPDDFESIRINAEKAAESIAAIKESINTAVLSLQNISSSIDTLILNAEIDFSEYKNAAENISDAAEYFNDAIYSVTQGLEALGTGLGNASEELENYTDDMSKQLILLRDNMIDAVKYASDALKNINNAASDINEIIRDLSDEEDIEFVKFGDDFKEAGDALFDSVSGISAEIDQLKNAFSGSGDEIIYDLTGINDQINIIINLMAAEAEGFENEEYQISDIFLDVSDQDIENAKQGKTADCVNFGKVESDRNTGGIAGAVAIEYSKDPEDDIERPKTLNFTYLTKAIIQSCVNNGNITGRKDCAGGIAGLAEIGTVYMCENYGNIESEKADYVGGIAGKSESSVRKSYSKSNVSGKRYIGGVAGKGDVVTECYSVSDVNGSENTGAVCGGADKIESIAENYYVDNGLGAVDGISYKGAAEPISFEELKKTDGIPENFVRFTVTFKAEEKIIETREIEYGVDTAQIIPPSVPDKDGYFGKWQKITDKTVKGNIEVLCEYQPYITILGSAEKSSDGKLSLALAQGEFTDEAELHVTKSEEEPPKKSRDVFEVYDISILNSNIKDGDTVTLRMLNENQRKVTAWRLNDGKWEKIKISEKGKYILFDVEGTENTVCLQYSEKKIYFVCAALVAVFIIFCISFVIYRKKRRNNI